MKTEGGGVLRVGGISDHIYPSSRGQKLNFIGEKKPVDLLGWSFIIFTVSSIMHIKCI